MADHGLNDTTKWRVYGSDGHWWVDPPRGKGGWADADNWPQAIHMALERAYADPCTGMEDLMVERPKSVKRVPGASRSEGV